MLTLNDRNVKSALRPNLKSICPIDAPPEQKYYVKGILTETLDYTHIQQEATTAYKLAHKKDISTEISA